MRTDCAVTRMSGDRVVIMPIVDRMADACDNTIFPRVGKIRAAEKDLPVNRTIESDTASAEV